MNGRLHEIFELSFEIVKSEMSELFTLLKQGHDLPRTREDPFRERHMQCALFCGLRPRFMTRADTGYLGGKGGRQIDLAILLGDADPWLFLEVKNCATKLSRVYTDAEKLVADSPTQSGNELRGLLVFGFEGRGVDWPPKCGLYEQLGRELIDKWHFEQINIRREPLNDPEYQSLQMGLWVLGL